MPLLNVGASQIGLGLGYQGGRWAGSLNGGYDLGGQQLNASLGAGYTFDDGRQLTGTLSGGYSFLQSAWTVGANAGYALSSTQQLNAFVNSSSGVGGAAGRVSAGVGLRYTPSDQLSVEAGASVATGTPVTSVPAATPTDPAATTTRYGGTLAASYVIAPGQTVRASTDFASLSASYEDSRTLYTSANATLSRTGDGLAGSLSGEVRGAVTFLEGRPVLGQKLGQRAVVVRTGTPNIPLLLNGARVAVTDAAGEALLTGLPEGSVSQVAVDLDALPFNITARDATADIALAQSGHKVSPRFPDPLEIWGEAFLAQGDAAGAAAKFSEAARLAPRWGRLHLKWGEALAKLGNAADAQAQWRAAAALDLTPEERLELPRRKADSLSVHRWLADL